MEVQIYMTHEFYRSHIMTEWEIKIPGKGVTIKPRQFRGSAETKSRPSSHRLKEIIHRVLNQTFPKKGRKHLRSEWDGSRLGRFEYPPRRRYPEQRACAA